MESIISLKKHLDSWDEEAPDGTLVDACRVLLRAAGSSGRRAVPDLGPDLEQDLLKLAAALSPPVTPELISKTAQAAEKKLTAWAEEAFLQHEANERELREISDVMAKAIVSVAERDELHSREVNRVSHGLRSIAALDDLGVIRRSILESANTLTACVERMAEDSKEALCRLSTQVEDYRSRLVKSERLLFVDVLTGLANRRCFEKKLSEKIGAGTGFCLILIDLNDFKAINDHFGHLAGDEVLKNFAQTLRVQFPSADVVARWGGDEFAVILTTSLKDAEARVRRIRRSALGEYKVELARKRITICVEGSIGVVEWDGVENGIEMLARADDCMYRGKESMKAVRPA